MDFRERFFEAGDVSLYARCWGREDSAPLLALHGWLDNCASFDWLAGELAADYYVVCLDLAGHGHSGHRSHMGAYNIWQDVAEIFSVADQLGWRRFNLIGHSRGAMIAFLAAGTFPDRVARLVMLEGIIPITAEPEDAPDILAKAITFLSASRRRQKPIYPTFDDAVSAREHGYVPVSREDARCLAQHGVELFAQGCVWRHDHKLMAGSEVRFSMAHIDSFKQRLPARKLLVLAEQGHLLKIPDVMSWIHTVENLEKMVVPGGHHFHMRDGFKNVASIVRSFVDSRDKMNSHRI